MAMALLKSASLLLLTLATGLAQAQTWHHERGTITLEQPPQRVVALNWAATEALLLLDITPVGAADKDYYRVWVQEPELPDSVANVGTRSSPSLAAISELQPDLIVTSGQLAPAYEQLQRIAPTYVISVYDEGVVPSEQATTMLKTLGQMFNRESRAEAVLAGISAKLAANRERLAAAGLTDKPVAIVNFMDDRHVRVYAPNGLLQAGLEGLGLSNAWTSDGNFWGFSLVGLEALAPLGDARLVAISPTPPGLSEQLSRSPFWTHLPMVRNREVYQINPVWTFGGVHSISRLADELTDQLLQGGGSNVR
ncbi:MAG: iron-siderophore ABC transporter substrate-binding protein [Marinobacter sp.]|uniref:ABC transporter substrate-binding protein n=1 Tax=Marinobacter sp. TaxID=50741 RepID=UPI00299D56D6|nr:iron-siderophore ABC transporter substrate-binding protein [Marinobacter sp.]MDX1754571.1 iron-siderophore ABC transporter substrate-binding protein [Marinobacter sp.]